MRDSIVLFLAVSLAGCGIPAGSAGPASTDSTSASLATLAERVEFLQRYVTFRRNYRDLSFHVVYHNNGGGLVPGPSDWDVRFVAVVPPEEIASWVPEDATAATAADRDWLATVPDAEKAATITEWYVAPGSVIGVDREKSIVAYRRWSS